jgi:hypothetical protein
MQWFILQTCCMSGGSKTGSLSVSVFIIHFYSCATIPVSSEILEHFYHVYIQHTETDKLPVLLPPDIQHVCSMNHCIPSLLERQWYCTYSLSLRKCILFYILTFLLFIFSILINASIVFTQDEIFNDCLCVLGQLFRMTWQEPFITMHSRRLIVGIINMVTWQKLSRSHDWIVTHLLFIFTAVPLYLYHQKYLSIFTIIKNMSKLMDKIHGKC